MSISIIIPVFHEEKNIIKVLGLINNKVKTEHEILVVYDTVKDPTYDKVRKYKVPTSPRLRGASKNRKSIKLIKNSEGNGKGVMNAIKTGFKSTKGEAIVVVMADLSDDITQVDQMYKLIKDGDDIVCASRYMNGGKKIGGPLFKTFLSKAAGLTLHYFFGVPTHDSTNAFKMYKREVLKKIKVESTGGFEYSLEIVVKAFKKGYKITEIPTVWRDREKGKSNFKLLKWLPKYIKLYLSILNKN